MNRDERLLKEYQRMQDLVSKSALISFKARGVPPDRYAVTFRCAGLAIENGVLMVREEHIGVIFLHSRFPTQAPRVTWRTPIFHPNFLNVEVCLGESWTPSMTVAQLCLSLGEMIQYKNYNIDDPLNGRAAAWVLLVRTIFPDLFPIDDRNLLEPVVFLESRKAELSARLKQLTVPGAEEPAVEDIVLTLP